MKKRYHFKQRMSYLIFASVVIIILLVGVIVNAIELSHIYELDLRVLPIISICVSVVILIFVLFITFNTHYTLSDKHFAFVIGFIYNKKNYSDILLLRENADGLLLMYFKRMIKGEEYIEHMVINIRKDSNKDFIDTVREHNPSIKYELFNDYRSSDNGYSDSEQ